MYYASKVLKSSLGEDRLFDKEKTSRLLTAHGGILDIDPTPPLTKNRPRYSSGVA